MNSSYYGDGCVPLEMLIDHRYKSSDFDRLVPQTDATFHYDKFNRLRLRNNVTSVTRTENQVSIVDDSTSNEIVFPVRVLKRICLPPRRRRAI
jgi:hypothetical protein